MLQDTFSVYRENRTNIGIDTFPKINSSDSAFYPVADSLDDSIAFSTDVQNAIATQEPLFNSHKLSAKSEVPNEHSFVNIDWITIHILICLGLIAWVQVFYRSRLKQIVNAFLGTRSLYQLYREGNIFRERISIPLFITFLISYSLFAYVLVVQFTVDGTLGLSGLKQFSQIMVIVLLSWFLKNLIISFIGIVFRNYLILTEYLLLNFVFNILSGLILLPIIIFAIYLGSVEWMYSAVIIWLLIFLYRVIRELFTRLSYRNFSLFYRILYLCTFEIIPLLVFTKLIMNYLF